MSVSASPRPRVGRKRWSKLRSALREKLNRGDWIFLALCGAVFVVGLAIGIQYFDDAFPEAAIDFKFNRAASGQIAEKFLAQMGLAFADYRHASEFRHDDTAKIFLERTVGLQKVNELTRGEVRIWAWRHRWFKPLQIEEVRVDIAPTGEVVSFFHKVPEDRAAPALDHDTEESQAEGFLRSVGVAPEKLELVSRSEKVLPKRTDVTYVWESQTVKPGGAPYRYTVEFHGNRIGAFSQSVKVPDQWIRDYQKLRSKNIAAGAVDEVFLALTIIGALIIFIVRLRRGDLHLRFSLGAGLIGALLIILVSLNEFPSAMANYDTSTSFAAFIAQQILFPILQGLVGGILLAVIVGSGEVMYRQRFPRHLAMPLVVSRRSLTSKRVFKGFILGYALFAAFLAYQVIFYIVASRYGAWSPAEIPYTSILNSAFPWAAVLFMGFFPAVSEEFLSRAFSIPFFERFLRSKYAAIILAGFVWGFGHAAYPNQPFYIRGVEVGIAGVVMGLLMYRFGLIGLLVWHYTVDALYTSFLLFRSGNPYYIFSAGLASLIFVIPTFVAIAMYMRNRGFIPDDDLNNSVLGVATVVPEPEEERPAELAPTVAAPVTRVAVVTMIVLVALAAAAIAFSGPALDDVIDYRITKAEATAIARRHLAAIKVLAVPPRVIPIPVDGFRAWNPDSRREDGGAPTGYDLAAVQYLLDHAPSPVRRILGAQRNEIEAATWMTRFFEPGKKEEIFVEVDPRTSLPIGYHRYRDEEAPGPSLEQSAAEPIARAEMTRYGLKADDFELKEALNFQQPKRRDWLFHYQEKKPLADEATRRATVRVMGNEVTQFAKTVKIPERDRREFEKETVVNTIITVLRIAAIVTLFGLVIYGVVAAARGHRFAWKPALRWALMLAPLPILAVFLQREVFLSQYDTSTPWETFTIVMFVATGFLIAFQIGVVWLSIAILETIIPGARRLLGSEGARRYGAAAVVAALSAVAMSALSGTLLQHLVTWFPRHAPVDGLGPPMVVAIPLPAIGILWQAILAALALSAAVAGFVGALRATPPNRRKVIHAIAITCLLLIGMDSSVQRHQMPLMILTAIVGVVVVYAIVAWILRDNLIAYPLAVFVMSLASAAVGLLQNHRADLQINAYILIAIALAALAFYALIPLRHQTTRGRGDAETRRHGDTGM